MGYKKLDEVMELLNDELDGFNKAISRLEKLIQNTDNITISPDTSKIEYMFKEHLDTEKANQLRLQGAIQNITEQMDRARWLSKAQVWLHYIIWLISIVIIGYLAFRVSQIKSIQENAFVEGKKEVISSLKGYFDQYPEHYKTYENWIQEKDRIPNQK